MSICAIVIHLRRAVGRRPQVDKLLSTLPFDPAVLDGVDAQTLPDTAIEAVYHPGLHRPHYPFPLRRTEVACFLSHREAWRRIVEGGHTAGLIVEDDVDFDPHQLEPALDFAAAVLKPADYVRLPYRPRGENGRVLHSHCDLQLIEPAVVGLGMQMQLVGREAAARALAATASFDRPVDTTLQMRWVTGLRMLTLRPVVIREIGALLGGTTVQKKKPLADILHREWRRTAYRLNLRWASRGALR